MTSNPEFTIRLRAHEWQWIKESLGLAIMVREAHDDNRRVLTSSLACHFTVGAYSALELQCKLMILTGDTSRANPQVSKS